MMLVLLYQLIIFSLFCTMFTALSNVKSILISKSIDNVSAKTNYNYEIDPQIVISLCNHLSDYNTNQHQQHHQEHLHHHRQDQHHSTHLLGEFILPYELASTIQRLIMKDNDPYIHATERIGDNIKKASDWNKVNTIIDSPHINNKKSIYSREISYVHNRKSSMFATKSTAHNLLQVLSLKAFDTGHVNHALLLGFMNLSHVPFCHNCHYTTLWDFSTFRGRVDSNKYSMTRVKVTLDIEGLPNSIYQSIIKNEIIKDLKAYVEEFRLCSMQQSNLSTNRNLSNDEKELLNALLKQTKPTTAESTHTFQNNNNLNNNFWTLPTGLQDHTRIGSFVLSCFILYKKFYQTKLKRIGINVMPNISLVSKFSTTITSFQKKYNGNMFTKIRKIF